MPAIGVKNKTDEEQALQFDGRVWNFKPSEIKIVEDVPSGFILGRIHVSHAEDEKGNKLPTVVGERLFEVLSLEDAFKAGAKLPEDPAIVAQREAARKKAEERAALTAEITAGVVESLKAQGWKPPEEK